MAIYARNLNEEEGNKLLRISQGISPSNMKVTKKKPLVIVEEENLKGRSPEKEYLLCPHCAGNGIIERISIKGLKNEIDACDECDLTWEKGTALQSYSIGLFDDYIVKEGIPFSKLEIKKSNPLLLMEEDQV